VNLLLSILVAAAIIAALIIVRIVVDRRAFAERLRSDRAAGTCSTDACFRGCGPDAAGSGSECAPGRNELPRSTSNAS
jgi:hypothetical protein